MVEVKQLIMLINPLGTKCMEVQLGWLDPEIFAYRQLAERGFEGAVQTNFKVYVYMYTVTASQC